MQDYMTVPAAPSGMFQTEDEEQLLEILEHFCNECGWKTEITADDSGEHFLRTIIAPVGKIQNGVVADVNFVHASPNGNDFVGVQVVATVFDDIPEETREEILHACARTNIFVLQGSFNISKGILFFRDNLILRPNYPVQMCAQLMTDVMINLRQTIDITIDGMAMIGRGMESLEQAIEAGHLE